ncbi:MAG: RloB domain-containing protein [Treponema sp.]|nr:RloB domain-containing protein [Treponema sp.]
MIRKGKNSFKSSALKKRDSGTLKIKPLVIISCEGTKTEPNYLRTIINELIKNGKIARGSVVIADHQHTDPMGVLSDLVNYRNDYTLFEEKWIVIDRDEVRSISSNSSGHPEENFVTALTQAEKLNIEVAWSNPCFEIFIVEHYMYRDTGGDRKDIQEKALELLCKDGKIKEDASVEELKAIDNLYDILLPRKETGIKNLKKLMNVQKGKSPVEANPGTRFHELVKVLEEYFEKE